MFAVLLVASALKAKTCCQKENPQNLPQSGEQQERWAGESSCIFRFVAAAGNKRRLNDAANKKWEKVVKWMNKATCIYYTYRYTKAKLR